MNPLHFTIFPPLHSLDDLLVSAPFYYTSSSSGAVYVYMNQGSGFTADHPYTKLEGER